MPLTHPVTASDLEARLGRTLSSNAEVERAEAAIDDAYALAGGYSLLSDPVTASQLAVIVRVALRAFQNPNGPGAQGPVGEFRAVGNAGIYFDKNDFAGMRGTTGSGVYSVPLTTPADHVVDEVDEDSWL